MIKFTEILKIHNIKELYDYQKEAIEETDKGKNLIVSTPTASGKTLIAEYGIVKALNNGGRAIYVVPMRALAREKFGEFKIYKNFGYNVLLEMGDLESLDVETLKYKWLNFDILFATAEKMDAILRANVSIKGLKFLVVDEIHFLGSPDRGSVYEILIAKLRKNFPDIQILGLSATIGNTDELAKWLNASLIQSSFRPVPLTETIETKKDLKTLVAENLPKGNILIFTNSKKRCENLCVDLSGLEIFKNTDYPKPEDEILNAIESPTEQCKLLSDLVSKGISFHHAGLTNKQRELVEESFKNGKIKVIVATPTLAYGVNLPAHTVIIEKLIRYTDRGMIEIPVLEYKQMSGRSGRPKYDKEGIATIMANKSKEKHIREKYINGKPEDIDSYILAEPNLRFHTMSLISEISEVDEILKFFDTTFGMFRYRNPEAVERNIINIINKLKDWKFVEEKNHLLNLTPVGNRINQMYIDPLTANRYIKIFSDKHYSGSYDDIDTLFILCMATEIRLLYISREEEDDILGEFLSREKSGYLEEIGGDKYLERFKTANMFNAWINEKSENYIYSEFNASPGLLHQKVEIGQWLIYAACELGKILKFPQLKHLMEMHVRVKYGIRRELIELISVKGIGRVRARALFNDGFVNKEMLRKASVEEITVPLKSKKIAVDIKKEVEVI